MSIGGQQILPTVIIKVEKAGTPSQKRDGWLCDSRLITDFGKVAPAIVAVERIVVIGKNRVVEIEQPVVEVVAHCDSHRCGLAAILVQRIT